MKFHQFFDTESSTYTYLLASEKTKDAVIIDPVLSHVEDYLQFLKDNGLQLSAAIDTHVHADHITGNGTLAKLTGCKSMMGDKSKAEHVDVKFSDNDLLEFGDLQIKVLYTPGHTDDSYCFLVDNKLFTGDTLFIGGTGRTDFQHGSANQQYESLFNKILKLPEDTIVYPGHDYHDNTSSTIGEEIKSNPRLQVKSKEEYIELMDNLNLAKPKLMNIAVPANLKNGLINYQ